MSTPTTILQLDKPAVGGDADVWGGLLNVNLDDLDIFVEKPRLKKNAPAVAGTTTLDLSLAMAFEFTVSQVTTIAITNVPATLPDGTVPFTQIIMKITNGGAFTVTWPASFVWSGGAAPSLAAAGVDFVVARTYDAGTTWYASVPHFVADPTIWPRASVYHSATQAVGPGGTVTLAFNTERFDVGTIHDTAVNNSRLTVPAGQGGLYLISGHVLNSVAGGDPRLEIRKNAASTLRSISIPAGGGAFAFAEVLAAADFVELRAREISGGVGYTVGSGIDNVAFEITRIR